MLQSVNSTMRNKNIQKIDRLSSTFCSWMVEEHLVSLSWVNVRLTAEDGHVVGAGEDPLCVSTVKPKLLLLKPEVISTTERCA